MYDFSIDYSSIDIKDILNIYSVKIQIKKMKKKEDKIRFRFIKSVCYSITFWKTITWDACI